MITELARLDVRPGEEVRFEAAFREAQSIIASMPGYLGHELRPCIERSNRYLLLVRWRRLEDHTLGFRGSRAWQRWSAMLHPFYEPLPEVEHYGEPLA